MEPVENKVYVCLDIDKLSFGESNHGTPAGVLITGGLAVGYWVLNLALLQTYALIMNTLDKKKPLLIVTVIFLIIFQKLVRVLIIKEAQLLKDFASQTNNNLVTLGEYYDIKTAGFEPVEGQNYHKIMYKDGSEGYIIKFLRGSITSEYTDTKTGQIQVITKFLNTLMYQGISPRIILSDERTERVKTFKFFQNTLRGNDFDDEFVELCNSTLMYHRDTAENYARIPASYYIVTATTAREKKFLHNFIGTVGVKSKASTFREIAVMNKTEILNLVKDLSYITHIDESDLQEKEASLRVPIGESSVLSVIRGGVEEVLNEPYDVFQIKMGNIDFEMVGRPAKKVKKEELINPLDEETDNILEGLVELEELPKVDGLQFKEHSAEMDSTESVVLLLSNIVNEDCKLIVL